MHISRGRVRVRQPVRAGLRAGNDGAERGALRRGPVLRGLLRAAVPRQRLLRARRRSGDGDGDQRVPGQLLQAQRELVQPAAAALRPVQAHVPSPRHRLPRRHRPRAVPPRALRQARRRALRDEGEPVVGRRARLQRRRRWGRQSRGREGVPGRAVGGHVAQLGADLGRRRAARRAGTVVPGDQRRRPLHRLRRRRAADVDGRSELRGKAPVLIDREPIHVRRNSHKINVFCRTIQDKCSEHLSNVGY
jgi:hypothetical protein